MKLAITSTVVLEVPDAEARGRTREGLASEFLSSNQWAIGRPMQTVYGVEYVLRAIEAFKVEQR
jgi:hypothetical protein